MQTYYSKFPTSGGQVNTHTLYGSETWVVPPHDLLALEGFHVETARRLTGMRPTKRGETWVYPKSVNVLRAARVRTIGEYIEDRRRNILRTIADRPILNECRGRRGGEGAHPAFIGGSKKWSWICPRRRRRTFLLGSCYVVGRGRLAGFEGGGLHALPPDRGDGHERYVEEPGERHLPPPPRHGNDSMEGTGACSCQHR